MTTPPPYGGRTVGQDAPSNDGFGATTVSGKPASERGTEVEGPTASMPAPPTAPAGAKPVGNAPPIPGGTPPSRTPPSPGGPPPIPGGIAPTSGAGAGASIPTRTPPIPSRTPPIPGGPPPIPGGIAPTSGAGAAIPTHTPPITGPGVPNPVVGARPPAAAATPSAATSARAESPRGPRRARLQLRHIDPWTVLKFSCVLSIALFFVWLIVVGVLFGVLDAAGVIGKINHSIVLINGPGSKAPVTAGVVFGGAAIIGVINIVLFIALSTIGSVVYNLCADLVGGVELTLSER
ncbi:MAG: hypothetical protein DLM57_08460 [Pseudonocardiales bacterium]|nr:MAG: hypothetical protein DLM57_08460 [Pseudonocardiales bacterium]